VNTPPALQLRGVGRRYGDAVAVQGVDLELPEGAFLVLLGPSGCGKSTLLRLLAGLEPPSEGRLVLHGREVAEGVRGVIVPPGERGLGLVFQSYALWPHMTVAQNVDWPLKVARRPRAERDRRVDEVLALLGIQALAARYPGEISGGQQQRVAIARMLAPAPRLLLFDEPLSNLDAKLRVEMRAELLRVHRRTGATSVYVTHDQVEAMTMATHVAVLNQGRVEQFGPPAALVERPATAFVATFVGTPPANVVPVDTRAAAWVVEEGAAPGAPGHGCVLAPAMPAHPRARLLYRATDLRGLAPGEAHDGPVIEAPLVEVAPMAGRQVATVLCASTRLSVVMDTLPALDAAGRLRVGFPRAPRAVFDAHGALVAAPRS
jgi:iron(III) transport system ATP-binding protein